MIFNIRKVNKYIVGILNSLNALPIKYTKLNVHWIKVILLYLVDGDETMW